MCVSPVFSIRELCAHAICAKPRGETLSINTGGTTVACHYYASAPYIFQRNAFPKWHVASINRRRCIWNERIGLGKLNATVAMVGQRRR